VTLFIGFAPWPVVLIWAYVDVPCKEEYDTPLGVDGERLDKFYEQGKGLAVAATFRASVRRNPDVHETPPRQSRSEEAQAEQAEGDRSASPFASASSNPAKGAAAKRK
jgi:hypothetical protein